MEENNQEKNDVKFRSVTTGDNTAFRAFNTTQNGRVRYSFGKTVAIPFLCGILGAGVVIWRKSICTKC